MLIHRYVCIYTYTEYQKYTSIRKPSSTFVNKESIRLFELALKRENKIDRARKSSIK